MIPPSRELSLLIILMDSWTLVPLIRFLKRISPLSISSTRYLDLRIVIRQSRVMILIQTRMNLFKRINLMRLIKFNHDLNESGSLNHPLLRL
jgi:hypothetical protein